MPQAIGRPKGGDGNTRQRIYETAMPMFLEKGYDNVSINDICRKMGLTKGAFYAHFKSKDQLVVERILRVDAHYRKNIFPGLAGLETVDEKIRTFCRLVFRHMQVLGKPMVKAAYYIQIGRNAKVSGMMTEIRELYDIIEELIFEGQQKGEFRDDMSADRLRKVAVHNIRGLIYNWCLPHSDFDLEEAGEDMLAVLHAGLKKGA